MASSSSTSDPGTAALDHDGTGRVRRPAASVTLTGSEPAPPKLPKLPKLPHVDDLAKSQTNTTYGMGCEVLFFVLLVLFYGGLYQLGMALTEPWYPSPDVLVGDRLYCRTVNVSMASLVDRANQVTMTKLSSSASTTVGGDTGQATRDAVFDAAFAGVQQWLAEAPRCTVVGSEQWVGDYGPPCKVFAEQVHSWFASLTNHVASATAYAIPALTIPASFVTPVWCSPDHLAMVHAARDPGQRYWADAPLEIRILSDPMPGGKNFFMMIPMCIAAFLAIGLYSYLVPVSDVAAVDPKKAL